MSATLATTPRSCVMKMIEKWENNIPRTVGDGECVALIKFYEKDVLGFDEYFGIDYAKEYFTKYNETNLKNRYEETDTTVNKWN